MPSTIGIVASGEDVLNDAVFWVDAGQSSVVSGALSNLGTGGSALNAVFGNSSGTDSFDPALLAHTGTNYLYLPGVASNYARTPTSTVLDALTGDIEVVFRADVRAFTVSAGYLSRTGCWRVIANAVDGTKLHFGYWNGLSWSEVISNTGLLQSGVRWYRVRRVVSSGIVTWETAADSTVEPSAGWSPFGSLALNAGTNLPTAANPLEVGTRDLGSGPMTGSMYRAIVRNGIGGTTVFDADFTTGITSGSQTTFTESSENAATVTINRSTAGRKAVAVTRPILLFGTDDYLEVADNDLLDFAAGEPFTVAVVTRQWNTITSQGALIAKKTSTGAAGTGWLIRNGIGTPADTLLDTYDGTTATSRAAPTSKTSGALCVITGVGSSSQLTTYFNNTASAATTRQAGDYANSEVMRIGRLSGAATQYTDMELVAAAVWRRALNANEIATIVARYT